MKTRVIAVPQPPDGPQVVELDVLDYDAMRSLVGDGCIERVTLAPGIDLWCNDEGTFHWPLNRLIPTVGTSALQELEAVFGPVVIIGPGKPLKPGERGFHRIHGPFFICGEHMVRQPEGYEEPESRGLTPEEVHTWMGIVRTWQVGP